MYKALKTASWQTRDFKVIYLVEGESVDVNADDAAPMIDAGYIEVVSAEVAHDTKLNPVTNTTEQKKPARRTSKKD